MSLNAENEKWTDEDPMSPFYSGLSYEVVKSGERYYWRRRQRVDLNDYASSEEVHKVIENRHGREKSNG